MLERGCNNRFSRRTSHASVTSVYGSVNVVTIEEKHCWPIGHIFDNPKQTQLENCFVLNQRKYQGYFAVKF